MKDWRECKSIRRRAEVRVERICTAQLSERNDLTMKKGLNCNTLLYLALLIKYAVNERYNPNRVRCVNISNRTLDRK